MIDVYMILSLELNDLSSFSLIPDFKINYTDREVKDWVDWL